MPSGAKKRKSSKRPKPKGDDSGPQLEAGLGEAMEDNGVEVGDGSPSPREDSEGLDEKSLETKGINGEPPEERDDESEAPPDKDLQTNETAADPVDPPLQAEPDLEIPAGIKEEPPVLIKPQEVPLQEDREPDTMEKPVAFEPKEDPVQEDREPDSMEKPVVFEPKEDPVQEDRESDTMEKPAQNEADPLTDSHLGGFGAKVDPFEDDGKPETDMDAVPDVTPAPSADEIKPDADDGLDKVCASEESATLERGSAREAGSIGNESGIGNLDTETRTDAPSDDLAGAIDDVAVMEIPSVEVKSEVHEAPVEVKSEADTTPIELETNNAPDEIPVETEQEMDGALAETKPVVEVAQAGDLEGAAPVDSKPDMKEAPTMERELVMDGALAETKPEVEEAQAGDLGGAAPVDGKPDMKEAPIMESELEMDGALAETEPEVEEAQAGDLEGAAPVDTKPDMEEAPTMERELETDGAPTVADREGGSEYEIGLDAQPDMNAAPADAAVETGDGGHDIDTSPYGIPRDVDASLDENPTEAVTNSEKLRLEEPVEAERNEESGAEISPFLALEPDVEALKEEVSEENLDGGEIYAKTEAKPELPLEAETESKPQDVTEDASLEKLSEIESEAKVDAIDEAKPEDEVCIESKAEESGSVERDVDGQDLAEEMKAVPDIEPEPEPEPEVVTSRGTELDQEAVHAEGETVDTEPDPEVRTSHGMEAEVEAVDAQPEPAAEAPVDLELDERGSEAQSGQPDLVQMDPDLSENQHQEKQDIEEDVGGSATSIPEASQSLESETRVADASEVPAEIENEPDSVFTLDDLNKADDSTSSVSSSDSSDHGEAQKTSIKPDPESGGDIPPSATALQGEDEGGVSGYDQESSMESEQVPRVSSDIEEGVGVEIRDESKEDTDMQERALDDGHDKSEVVSASAGREDETEKASEQQEVATSESPPYAIAESVKEGIGDQNRTVDVGHDEGGALLMSAGKNAEVEEQESCVETPLPDAFTVEEPTKEGSPPDDPEHITAQYHLIDDEDRSGGGDEPPRVESEKDLQAAIPVESDTFSGAPYPQEEALTPATSEKVASEYKFPLDSVCAEPEKDVGEEETASSTVAEVGSVLNDLDERAFYQQDLLPADFTSVDQDTDTSDSKESHGSSVADAPEYVGIGSREPVDSEITEAAKPEGAVDSACSNEQSPLLQPEQDNIFSPEADVLRKKELHTDGEEGAMPEDEKASASSPILGSALPVFSGDELISQALPYLGNGQPSMSNPEILGKENRDKYITQIEASNTDTTQIPAMKTRELKESDLHKPVEVDTNIDAEELSGETPSPTTEDRDIKEVQAFRQETSKEASQPVVVSTQDRGLENVHVKSMEQQSRGGGAAVEGRRKMLGCCGLFDALLGKN